MPAEVEVLGWRKGKRRGFVVRGAGGPGGGTVRSGGRGVLSFESVPGHDGRLALPKHPHSLGPKTGIVSLEIPSQAAHVREFFICWGGDAARTPEAVVEAKPNGEKAGSGSSSAGMERDTLPSKQDRPRFGNRRRANSSCDEEMAPASRVPVQLGDAFHHNNDISISLCLHIIQISPR